MPFVASAGSEEWRSERDCRWLCQFALRDFLSISLLAKVAFKP